MTKESIDSFGVEFRTICDVLEKMEGHNNCITRHKRRITTDLYSLWAAIALNEDIRELDDATLAERYDQFMTSISEAYELSKDGKPINDLDEHVQLYFGNSTGASTEVEPRKKRHQSLSAYLQQ